jgi:hypothetical protein
MLKKKMLNLFSLSPIIPIQTIQSLGTELCKLGQDVLTEEALLKNRKQSSPIVPKKSKKTMGK